MVFVAALNIPAYDVIAFGEMFDNIGLNHFKREVAKPTKQLHGFNREFFVAEFLRETYDRFT